MEEIALMALPRYDGEESEADSTTISSASKSLPSLTSVNPVRETVGSDSCRLDTSGAFAPENAMIEAGAPRSVKGFGKGDKSSGGTSATEDQHIVQRIFQVLQEQQQQQQQNLQGWQVSFQLSQRVSVVLQLVKSIRMIKAEVPVEQAINVALQFEHRIYLGSPDKATYEQQPREKMGELARAQTMQQQVQENGQPPQMGIAQPQAHMQGMVDNPIETSMEERLASQQLAQDNTAFNRQQIGDYHMQLMLLEEQNKKRLLMARMDQDTSENPAPGNLMRTHTTEPLSPGKKRLSMARMATSETHTTDRLSPEGDEYMPRTYDESGERKVSLTGHLLDGRQYRIRTFCLPNRGDKLFMLATECARTLRYRDSYLLFNKNRSLYKIIATQLEKDHLIAQQVLAYGHISRQVPLVTAKSMFRQFGARVIENGRRVRDDYWQAKAIQHGFTEDDIAV